MGISLFGLTPAATYPALIKFGDNSAISGTLRALSDGLGTDLPIQVSTTGVNFTGTASIGGTALSPSSGVAGAIQFSNGSAFASDATNLFWDDTNNRLGIGTNTPTGIVQIKTTQANTNGSIIFTNNNASTIASITDTGSALTTLQFRASNFGFVDGSGVLIGGGYGDTPTARLQIKGSGSTSATTSLLVQNSAGTSALQIKDDLSSLFGGIVETASTGEFRSTSRFAIRPDTSTGADGNIVLSSTGGGTFGLLKLGGTTSAFPAIQRNLSEVRFRLADDSSFCNIRTRQHRFENASVLSDIADGVMIMANNAVNDFGRLCLGGTTSSFPAIKRNGTAIDFRLADDSGFANINAGIVDVKSLLYVAGQVDFGGSDGRIILPTAARGLCVSQDYSFANSSALLEVKSTTKGFLPPRMTTTQRDAIVTPATGLRIYNTTTNTNDTYNGTAWQSNSVSGVSGAIQFSNGSAFASDAANFFWDDTNNRLGIGTNTPTAATHIRGVDQLSTSTSLLVTDSIGTQILRVHNQAGNNAVLMSTAKIANYEIVSGDVLYNTSMRFVPLTTGLAINKDYSNPAASTLVHIKGSGSTSATTSLLVQNSAGTTALQVQDNLTTTLGGGLILPNFQTIVSGSNGVSFETFRTIFGASASTQAGQYAFNFDDGGGASGGTSGTLGRFVINSRFAPTSGTAVYNTALINPTVNQTGGANGITRGLYINPTLTAAADFRAIEVTNGNVLIGNSASNTAKLSIKGSGSTSATTSLLVQNSAGTQTFKVADDGAVTTGLLYSTGLSLTGNITTTGLIDAVVADLRVILSGSNKAMVVSSDYSFQSSASTIFEIKSTTKGFLPPRMTTTQKNAIASPAAGLTVYDSTTNKLNYNNGTTWKEITPDGYTGLVTINAMPPVTFDIQNGIIVNVI